ncbi:MAG: hypothetical protein AAGG68_02260 [Bacteroidota bacterium]
MKVINGNDFSYFQATKFWRNDKFDNCGGEISGNLKKTNVICAETRQIYSVLLSFFRTNQVLGSLIFLLYLFVLRSIPLLLAPLEAWSPKVSGVLFIWFSNLLKDSPIWMENVVSVALLFIHAVYITLFLRKNQMSGENILIPSALYLLTACAIPIFLHLNPILLANTFLLIAIDQMMGIYRNPNSAGKIFNIGFWIAVASLFYFSYSCFLFLAIFGLSSLRAFKLNEFLTLIIGALSVYFLAYAYALWNDQLWVFHQSQILDNIAILDFTKSSSVSTYVQLAIVGIFVLVALVTYGTIVRRQNMQFQKRTGILYIIAAISATSLLFQANVEVAHVGILIVPVGLLLGLMVNSSNKTSAEIIHLFLLLLVLMWQASPYWMSA